MAYDIYCDFDLDKHKQTYIDYLEVLILEDGKVVYAIPSHQQKAIALCCKKLNVSRNELNAMCPQEYYFDYLTWLLNICGAVSVWSTRYKTGTNGLNGKQRATLRRLKLNGLYRGAITN